MNTGVPNLLQQTELDVNHISDVQILLEDKSEQLQVINSFQHNEVLLLEIEKRGTTLRRRVLILGESLAQSGQVVLMRLSRAWGKAATTHGLDLDTAGGIYGTHWCSGLAIKQVPMKNNTSGLTEQRELHDFRERFCRKLLEMIKNDEHWSKQKWKDVKNEISHVNPLLRPKKPTIKTTLYTNKTHKRKRSVPELEKERSPSPVESDVPGCGFEINKFHSLNHDEVKRANILYQTIACGDWPRKIPEDGGFGDLMKKSYPWAPFPIGSLPGWRANKSPSGVPRLTESDWFISWWNLSSQRPTMARESDKIGSTGMTQSEIDAGLMELFRPMITLFVVNILWGGKIASHLKTRRGRVQDAKAEDVAMENSDTQTRTQWSLQMRTWTRTLSL